MKIFIDPGHGGESPGAVYKGRSEKDDTLRLSRAIRDILVKYKDIEVMLSREEQSLNAHSPIVLVPAGTLIEVNDVQL